MKLWKEIAAVVSLLAQAGASNLAFADPHSSAWKQEELNEQFMRSLTKQQCMVKTVADLKAGCTTEQCMKTLGGITGDCVTWATGSIATFCATYDRDYIARYCVSNELDARRCVFLHVAKPSLCEP